MKNLYSTIFEDKPGFYKQFPYYTELINYKIFNKNHFDRIKNNFNIMNSFYYIEIYKNRIIDESDTKLDFKTKFNVYLYTLDNLAKLIYEVSEGEII